MRLNHMATIKTRTKLHPATQKISTYLTLIVLIVMALSIAALLLAANAYFMGDATSRRRPRNHRLNRLHHVRIHALPIKEANSGNEN